MDERDRIRFTCQKFKLTEDEFFAKPKIVRERMLAEFDSPSQHFGMNTKRQEPKDDYEPLCCCICGETFSYIWATVIRDGEETHYCLDCHDKQYPQWTNANRLKKFNEQMELPI